MKKAVFRHNEIKYYYEDIVNAIKNVDIKKGDTVFIHADLGKFGNLADIRNRDEFNLKFLQACLG